MAAMVSQIKFCGPSLNGSPVIPCTNSGSTHTHMYTHRQMHGSNDNTQRPKLALGKYTTAKDKSICWMLWSYVSLLYSNKSIPDKLHKCLGPNLLAKINQPTFLRRAMKNGTRITGQSRQPTTSLHTWLITWDIKGCLCLFKQHSPKHTPDW